QVLAQQLAEHLLSRAAFELGANFNGAVLTLRGGRKHHQQGIGEFHWDLHSVDDGVSRRHHRSPAVAIKPTGQDPECFDRAPQARTVTLCWQRKSSLFWIRLLLVFGSDERMERYAHVGAAAR